MTAWRMAPHVACLLVADERGALRHHYHGAGSGASRGPHIGYLNEEQRAHFTRLGLVIEIDDDPAADAPVTPGLVKACIDALDEAQVSSDAGAPTARTVLRDAGSQFGNEVIAAAVRERRMRAK